MNRHIIVLKNELKIPTQYFVLYQMLQATHTPSIKSARNIYICLSVSVGGKRDVLSGSAWKSSFEIQQSINCL